MKIENFKLESFFNRYEFQAPHLLCCSDCESMTVDELLSFEPGAKEGFLGSRLGYSESGGDPELIAEIAKLYSCVDERGVLEFVGAEEAIFGFMNCALGKGDHMITMFPAYQSTYEVCRSIGCEITNWNLVQTENGWAIDTDDLAKLIRPNTKAIAVCSPNNPTGYRLSQEQNKAIAEIAGRHGLMVFSDEVYRGLSDDEPEPFADIYDNAFSLNVLSKAYGLAGLRLGWLASQNHELLRRMLNFKYYTSICSPVLSQKLAAIAVRRRDKIIGRNKEIINENLRYSDRFFEKHEEVFQYNRPMAGPIAFHRLKLPCPVEDFCERLVADKGVLLAPGSLFDMEGNYFRMGYGRRDYKTGLDQLDGFLTL